MTAERAEAACVACVDAAARAEPVLLVHERVAALAVEKGDTALAQSVLRCALEQRGQSEEEFTATVDLRVALGGVLFHAGDYEQAEEEFVQVYRALCAHPGYGRSAHLTGQVANSLGVVCKTAGRLSDAVGYYQAAFDVFAVGEYSDELASLLHNLAGLAYATDEPDRGLDHAWHGLYLRRKLHGDEHELVAADRSNLAGLLHAVGRLDEAARQLVLAIEVFRARLGDEHPEIAVCLSGLASIDADRGFAGAAERRYREAIAIKSRAFGDRHPDTLTTRYNLAKLLADNGDTAVATGILADVVDGLTGLVSDDHRVLTRARQLYRSLVC